jgi:ribosome-associated protein
MGREGRTRIPLPPRAELHWSFARSAGAGGQNVNKVETKAVLRWDVAHSPTLPADVRARLIAQEHGRITRDGELVLTSQRFRERERNVEDCLRKLEAIIAVAAVAPIPRRPTRPGRGAVERRLKAKRERAGSKRERGGGRGGWED